MLTVRQVLFRDAPSRDYWSQQMPPTYSQSFDGVGGCLLGVMQRSEVSDPRAPEGDVEPFVAEIVCSCSPGVKRSALGIRWNGDVAIGLELRR